MLSSQWHTRKIRRAVLQSLSLRCCFSILFHIIANPGLQPSPTFSLMPKEDDRTASARDATESGQNRNSQSPIVLDCEWILVLCRRSCGEGSWLGYRSFVCDFRRKVCKNQRLQGPNWCKDIECVILQEDDSNGALTSVSSCRKSIPSVGSA